MHFDRLCHIILSATLAALAVLGSVASASAQLSATQPSSSMIAWWRLTPPKDLQKLNTGSEQAVNDVTIAAVNLLDGDEPLAVIARTVSWAVAQGLPQTGCIFPSSQPAPARTKDSSGATPAALPTSTNSPANPGDASTPAPLPSMPASGAPAAGSASNPSDPAAASTRSPYRPGLAGPEGFAQPGLRSAALFIEFRAGQQLTLDLGDPGDVEVSKADVGGVSATLMRPKGWTRPIWVVQDVSRLVLASDQAAMAFALAPRDSTSPSEPDTLREDFAGHRKLIAKEKRASPTSWGQVVLNVNAMRHEFEQSFVEGRGARMLSLWRMPNVRSISIHASLLATQVAKVAGGAQGVLPPTVMLDLAWSAKSDAPGAGMLLALTSADVPPAQSGGLPTDAAFLLVFRSNIYLAADWFIYTFLATLDDESIGPFGQQLQFWLTDHRAILSQTREAIKPWLVLGPRGLTDPKARPVIPFRACVRSGFTGERIAEGLGQLTKIVGVEVDPKPAPEAADLQPPARVQDSSVPRTVWTVPVEASWLRGAVSWTMGRSHGTPVVLGMIGLAEMPGSEVIESVREQAKSADGKPLPKPLSMPSDALPITRAPNAQTPKQPVITPAAPAAPATP